MRVQLVRTAPKDASLEDGNPVVSEAERAQHLHQEEGEFLQETAFSKRSPLQKGPLLLPIQTGQPEVVQ